ncbi:MAG: hypothetical protein IPJ50_13630 [Betaproteobacteria bacterium]|nr:hypothetical protein [Betaproteobacteria bacterium]
MSPREREVDLPRKCAPTMISLGLCSECELAKLLVVWKTFRRQAKVHVRFRRPMSTV